jgi:hypothetical protein
MRNYENQACWTFPCDVEGKKTTQETFKVRGAVQSFGVVMV